MTLRFPSGSQAAFVHALRLIFDVLLFTDILCQMAHLQNNERKRTYCSSVHPLPMASLKLAAVPLTFLILCLSVLLQLVLEFIFSCLLFTMQQYQD
jgi:hypothetical protein